MASPSKRKVDDLETAANGTESKRVRTETPPKVNGTPNGRLSSPDPADRAVKVALPEKSAKKLKKKERRKLRKKDENVDVKPEVIDEKTKTIVNGEQPEVRPENAIQVNRKASKHTQEGKKSPQAAAVPNKQSPQWEITKPVGGTLADLDPVFSFDEQYVSGSRKIKEAPPRLINIGIIYSPTTLRYAFTRCQLSYSSVRW